MTHNPWGNNKHAPVAIKALAWFSVLATIFVVAHSIIQFVFADDVAFEPWIGELYFALWQATPVFLYLTGSMIAEKKLRITANIFMVFYATYYLVNIGNAYEWVDIPHLQYPASAALIGLLVTWFIHFFRRKKEINDFFKFVWLFGLVYFFAVPRFVQSDHEGGNFYLASLAAFPIMMSIGLYKFFANKNHSHE